MVRIILGVLIQFGLSVRALQKPFDGGIINPFELQGYLVGKFLLFVLSVWLLWSGIRSKKKKELKTPQHDFAAFLNKFFTNYSGLLSESVRQEHAPFTFFLIWVFGASRFLEGFHYALLGGNPAFPIQDWISMWLFSMLGGLILGPILYWVIGFIFHLGVRIAGGHGDYKASRMICLYSNLPLALTSISFAVINTITFESEYFSFGGSINSIWGGATISIIASTCTIALGYVGVRSVLKTRKIPSILLFIVVPLGIQLLLYFYT